MAVLDNFPDAVIACKANGDVVFLNRAAKRLYGTPGADPSMQQCAEKYGVFHPDGETQLTREELPLFRALQGEHVKNVALVIRSRETPFACVTANANPIVDESGKLVGAMVITQMHPDVQRDAETHSNGKSTKEEPHPLPR